jgi:hypothetical protein
MFRFQVIALFTTLLFAGSISSQSNENSGRSSDLTKLSSDELTACYDAPNKCGAKDVWEISDEFDRRLQGLPSDRLVACFENWKLCGIAEDRTTGWPISDELARRGHIEDLLALYWKDNRWAIRNGIEHVAYHFDSPEVTAFMRRVLKERVNDGEKLYWPVNYLAKKCDVPALQELSTGRYRNQGSLQYQTSVELFGKCKYRPAIPYLVDSCLFDASLNIVGAADDSLHALYPDSPRDFDSLENAQIYFCGRARREGLKVSCKAN